MVHPCDKPCANKAQSGYCATTVCINPKYSNIGTDYFPNGVTKQIVTNAMKIRAMTDEEMAKWHEYVSRGCDYLLPKCPATEACDQNGGDCENAWLDWLKEEVHEQ